MPDAPQLRVMPFAWGAAAMVAIFVGMYLFFIRTYTGQLVDERAYAGASAPHNAFVTFARHFLDVLPVAAVIAGVIVTVLIALVRRNGKVLIVALLAGAAANLSTEFLKYIVLDRPHTGATFNLANSFPSGHTTVAASAALAVFLVSSPRLRPVVAILGSVFAILAGTFTLISQWHRPSDVIAGFVVVAFWGCIAGCVLARMRNVTTERPTRSRLLIVVWVAAALAVGGAISLVITFVTVRQGETHLSIAYVGGIAAIASVGLLFGAVANRLFRALR